MALAVVVVVRGHFDVEEKARETWEVLGVVALGVELAALVWS